MFHVEHPGYPGVRINQVSELNVAYTTILSAITYLAHPSGFSWIGNCFQG